MVINVTFFNEFGNSFLNAMEKVADKTVIITICSAKVSDWKGISPSHKLEAKKYELGCQLSFMMTNK